RGSEKREKINAVIDVYADVNKRWRIAGSASLVSYNNALDNYEHFERHMEEIHMTWTQFEKKRDKIATLLEDDQDMAYNVWRRRHNSL
ncbi:hypothetical protein Tco_1007531, partial [Tanacetum coccineum]